MIIFFDFVAIIKSSLAKLAEGQILSILRLALVSCFLFIERSKQLKSQNYNYNPDIMKFLKLPLTALIASSFPYNTIAQSETVEACEQSATTLNDIPIVNANHEALIVAFDQICIDADLCYHDIDAFPSSMNPALVDMNTAINKGPVHGTATANFGDDFGEDHSIIAYRDSCNQYGGTLTCADVDLKFLGEAGASYAIGGKPGVGIMVDVVAQIREFPICMPRECSGKDDLTKVMEIEFRDAILQAPEFQKQFSNPNSLLLLKQATFEQACALSGLDSCDMIVSEVECAVGPGTVASGALSRELQISAALASALAAYSTL